MATTSPINALPAPDDSSPNDPPIHFNALNTQLDSRLVPRFATTAARDAAITSPVNGQVAWCDSPGGFYERTGANWVGRFLVSTMANRPTSGLHVGDHVAALDRPTVTYVWDGTRWVQEGIAGSAIPAGAPAGSYVSRYEDTVVLTTTSGGGFNITYPKAFSAVALFRSLSPGDSAGNVGFAVPIVGNDTASTLNGIAYTFTAAVCASASIRLNYVAIGYNT